MNSESSRTVILSIASRRSSWVRTAIVCVSLQSAGWAVEQLLVGGRGFPGRAALARLRALGLGLLVAYLREHGAEAPDVRDEQAGQRADRRPHPARQPSDDHLARPHAR